MYSHFFTTLHDDPKPVGAIRFRHTVLRAVIWNLLPVPRFHDFAIVWDDDHDTRIIWIVEQMLVRGLLAPVLLIGERKGIVDIVTSDPMAPVYVQAVTDLCANVPSDYFTVQVDQIGSADDVYRAIQIGRAHV